MEQYFKHKKLLAIIVLGLMFSGCSENKSESNRKKSTIKFSCTIDKIHLIRDVYDGTDQDILYLAKDIKKHYSIDKIPPLIIEIFDKDSLAAWLDTKPLLLESNNEESFSYLTETTKSERVANILNLR